MKKYAKGDTVRIHLTLNGQERNGTCESRTLLSDFLRDELGATGTHVGCEHGVCGACTVLVGQAAGANVTTIEGIASGDQLHPMQAAFRDNHGLQCGFCTAGILMSCEDYLRRKPNPTEGEVRDMLSGHLCRCTGYTNIVKAVLETAQERREKAAATTTNA